MSQTINPTVDDPPEDGCKQLSVSPRWHARERSTAAVSGIYPGSVVVKDPGLAERCWLRLNADNPGSMQAGLTLLFTCEANSLALHILPPIIFLLLVLNIQQINLQGCTLSGIIVHKSEITFFFHTSTVMLLHSAHKEHLH